MSEYVCIGCGALKESDNICSCSVCGYSMYPHNFNRADLLKSEIKRFINCIIENDFNAEDLYFNDKEDDEKRFPDFDKIRDYICFATKTEMFIERISNSVKNIRSHIHSSFNKEYYADLMKLEDKCCQTNEHLNEVLTTLKIKYSLNSIELSDIILNYSETPAIEIQIMVEKMLDMILVLSEKIHKFIKQNNVYGMTYQEKFNNPILTRKSENIDWKKVFDKHFNSIESVINNKYIVDIFDDGKKELHEMLKVLWDSLYVIMSAPVLHKTYIYSIEKQKKLNLIQCLEYINRIRKEQYTHINEIIHDDAFLADKSEHKLFELYNKILDLDYYDYLKLNKGKILKAGKNEEKLNALIGLNSIKESIKKIKAYAVANKNNESLNLHMCFYGNPGTGKTEVARIIAGILYENGLLPENKVIETDRSGLVAGYVGQTAIKTMDKVSEAMGGVLFIDEAYSLIQSESSADYGYEAVAALVKAMEDYRGKFCVILAGYKNPMKEMITVNSGFKSRIQFELDFENYNRDELRQITKFMLDKREYTISDDALEKILDITDVKRKQTDFANAREVRNIVEQVIMCQNLRCIGTDDRELALADVSKYISDSKINITVSGNGFAKKTVTALEQLEQLVGLSDVKRMIKKIRAYAKRNKDNSEFNIHMCFNGNPGTGKTEVARILSNILYEAGVLPEAKLVETNSSGLIGKYVGETGPKTLAKINEAMGGILFIDEAYSLVNNEIGNGYGDEAVAVLLKEMEDKRGQFCVIFAGYGDEMRGLINSNPGLSSRIQFSLDFPDYEREELSDIAYKFLQDKNYQIDNDALKLVLDITEYYKINSEFANARTIRNILEQVIMNQNLRTEDYEEVNSCIIMCDVEDYISDEKINLNDTTGKVRQIGFSI